MPDRPNPLIQRHPLRRLLPLFSALAVVLVVAAAATTTGHAAALGDVDCDGDADAVDALQVLRDVGGLGTSAGCLADAADTDCDGDRDSVDALRILQTVVGQQVSVPPGCGTIGVSLDVADVAPDLEFFGELASVHSEPVTETFGSGSATLPLADGATLEVPAGAFPASTDVTIAIIDLLYGDYLVDPPEGRIYVLSTEDPVALNGPLVLEVPRPADSVNAGELINGDWVPIDVPPGDTTRIEIDHFSERTIDVTDKPSGVPELRPEIGEAEGEVPGAFLVGCVIALTGAVGIVEREPGEEIIGPDDEIAFQLALSVCTGVLIDELTPGDDKVDVGCVGDQIGPGVDIVAAINACLAEPTATPAPGVIKVHGSFDESSLESVLPPIGFEANEITLHIPEDGGAVTGDFLLVARFDTTDDEGQCIVDEVLEGTFVESTHMNGQLSGTASIDVSIEKVVGCGTTAPPQTSEHTWSASFDGINVTNGVVVDLGTFTASIQP